MPLRSTAPRKIPAYVPTRDPTQPLRWHTIHECVRLSRTPRRERWPRGLRATAAPPRRTPPSARLCRETPKCSDKRRRRLPTTCTSRQESSAAPSPRGRATRYTPAAFALRIPAVLSARPQQPSAQSKSDSTSTGSATWTLRSPPPPEPARIPTASRSSRKSSTAIPARPSVPCIHSATQPKNSWPHSSNRRSTRPRAPKSRARAPANHLGHIGRAHHRSRRIRGRVEDDRLRSRCDEPGHHLGCHSKTLRLVRFQQNAIPASVANNVLERNPVRHRQYHFVAVIHQNLNRIEQRVLAAGRRDGFLAAIVGIEVHVVPVHDGVAQLGSAGHGRVLRKIALNRCDGRVFNVLRRREMRLARTEIDHVNSLLPQFIGLRHHRHRGGGLDAIDSVGKSQRFRGCRGHAFFFLFLGTSMSSLSRSVYAGSSFSRSFCSTASGTRSFTGPPACATSRTSRELTYEYLTAGIMKTVSRVGSSLRFMSAICSSYS